MNIRTYKGVTPRLETSVFVDPSAVLIGDITAADDVSFWPNVVARGDVSSISIGARTSVQDGTVLHVTHRSANNSNGHPLVIGSQVTIGHLAMLHGCTIGNDVLIGMGSMVMDGAVVESQVVLGGGSLVPPGKRLKSGYLYVGRPAKQVRELTSEELDFFSYTAGNYVNWKNEHMAEDWAK